MLTAVDDLPASLLREFARWYDTKAMSDRYAMFDFTEHLERITTPMLIIAGSHDGLTPVRDLRARLRPHRLARQGFPRHRQGSTASRTTTATPISILGLHAPDDVYPLILEWLEAHRQKQPHSGASKATLRAVRSKG